MRRLILGLATLLLSATAAAATPTDAVLDSVQHRAFGFFWYEANAGNGMIRDRSQSGSPASIAAVGFGLSAICTGIDHGWITRAQGAARVLATLQTFWNAPQGTAASGTAGYQGFFYHFLHMGDGLRQWEWDTELSTIDTALLLAGIIDAKQYFNSGDATEVQIRTLADQIYGRVDWTFVQNASPPAIKHGWKPGVGFIDGGAYWTGYNEMMIMYLLALGSPTHPVPASDWTTWYSSYYYTDPGYGGHAYVIFPPLFGHQYSHCWIDFRNRRDGVMQFLGFDYFENSRRATYAQQAYCIANPLGRVGYGANQWGLTAGDGPTGYNARGAPPAQNDDGTIAPTAVVGSLPFAPEICLPTIQHLYDTYPLLWGAYGFRDGFNLTSNPDWYDTDFLGIDQGPIVMMIENYRTGAIWSRFMQNADVQRGMTAAGFTLTTGVAPPPRTAQDRPVLSSSPNPFTAFTRVHFRLAAAGPARLAVYDLEGREVARLREAWTEAGEHTEIFRGDGRKAGVYWFRLEAGGREVLSKGILVR